MIKNFGRFAISPIKKAGTGNTGIYGKRVEKAMADKVMRDLFKPKPKKGGKR